MSVQKSLMKDNIVAKRYIAVLKPLTVVHVWSGTNAVVGLDLVKIDNVTMCLVDLESLPEDIVTKLAESLDINELTKLGREGKLPCKARFTIAEPLPESVKQIRLMSSQIVPGSELKGYIRTAILYHLLKIGKISGDELPRLIQLAPDRRAIKKAADKLETVAFRAERPHKQGGYADAFQMLLVSDPTPKTEIRLTIRALRVIEVQGQALREIAQNYAVVFESGELMYNITVLKPIERVPSPEFSNVVLKYRLLSEIDLVGALREFGCKLIEHELRRVQRIQELNEYRRFLEQVREKYCREGSKCVPVRIGFMTGHQAKTVLLYVKEKNPTLYDTITKTLSIIYDRVWDEHTLKLVTINNRLLGVGWCELCLQETQ